MACSSFPTDILIVVSVLRLEFFHCGSVVAAQRLASVRRGHLSVSFTGVDPPDWSKQ